MKNGKRNPAHHGATRRDPARNRERILAASLEEFARYGLGGARVDRIAERAGANKSMLYYYFGNKEGLFLAVLESRYAPLLRALVRHGYAGDIAVEPFDYVPDGPGAAARAIGYIKGILEALQER